MGVARETGEEGVYDNIPDYVICNNAAYMHNICRVIEYFGGVFSYLCQRAHISHVELLWHSQIV